MSTTVAMAALLLGMIAQTTATREPSIAGTILIADFDTSVRTEQGRFFDTVGGRPDVVRDRLVAIGDPPRSAWRVDVLAGAGRRDIALVVPADLRGCTEGPESTASSLTLRVIGNLANRRVSVEIATKSGSAPSDDSSVIGVINADQFDATRWQAIRLPVPERLRSSAATIQLAIEGSGAAWLAIDEVAFGLAASAARSARPTAPPEQRELRQCLWVWNTRRILGSPGEADVLLDFTEQQGFTDLFVQVVYEYRDGAAVLGLSDRQRELNARAAKRGIRIHALDGRPQYVLRSNHKRMIALTEALIVFNREAAPGERYRGLHLDNEPYVLPEWKSPDKRQELIDSYIELNQRISGIARAGKLEYGVDIPFWWDLRDASGEYEFRVSGGDHKPLLEALFPLLDNAGVMSYRPRVTGANGIIACCETEFELGRRMGVQVFASVETGGGSDVERGTTFAPYPREHFTQQLETLRRIAARTPGAAGISIHYYDALRAKLEETE